MLELSDRGGRKVTTLSASLALQRLRRYASVLQGALTDIDAESTSRDSRRDALEVHVDQVRVTLDAIDDATAAEVCKDGVDVTSGELAALRRWRNPQMSATRVTILPGPDIELGREEVLENAFEAALPECVNCTAVTELAALEDRRLETSSQGDAS